MRDECELQWRQEAIPWRKSAHPGEKQWSAWEAQEGEQERWRSLFRPQGIRSQICKATSDSGKSESCISKSWRENHYKLAVDWIWIMGAERSRKWFQGSKFGRWSYSCHVLNETWCKIIFVSWGDGWWKPYFFICDAFKMVDIHTCACVFWVLIGNRTTGAKPERVEPLAFITDPPKWGLCIECPSDPTSDVTQCLVLLICGLASQSYFDCRLLLSPCHPDSAFFQHSGPYCMFMFVVVLPLLIRIGDSTCTLLLPTHLFLYSPVHYCT